MKQKLIAFFKKKENVIALISLGIFAVLLAVDLATKAWAEETNIRQNAFFLGIVRFYFTKNTGMAFSWFDDNELAMTLVTIFTAILIVGLAVLFFTIFRRNTPARITLAVIEAGAIGNLIDRLFLGYVRDMVDVSPLGFGVCNFADFFITFGGVVLLFIIIFIGKDALYPLKKEWRDEAKREEEEKEALKAAQAAQKTSDGSASEGKDVPYDSSDRESKNVPKHDE